jgi:hypothetical protein
VTPYCQGDEIKQDVVTCRVSCVTYRTGFGLDDWIYCNLYIHTVQEYEQYSSIAILHTFQFTVAHALGFSVFNSRILATDLSQYHCHFKSHMKSIVDKLEGKSHLGHLCKEGKIILNGISQN